MDIEAKANKAAREFFEEAHQKALIGAHSVKIEKNIMLYDFIGAFEPSEAKVSRALGFLSSVQLGKIGIKAKEEFYATLEDEGQDDNFEEDNHDPDNPDHRDIMDEDALNNVMQD